MIAYDLDGTLYGHRAAPVPWRNAAALSASQYAFRDAVAAFAVLRSRPHAFVTGRTEAVRRVTYSALRRDFGVSYPALVMQDHFTDMDALADFKADALAALGASVYVGDHDVDLRAARRAGCEFVPALDLLDYARLHA